MSDQSTKTGSTEEVPEKIMRRLMAYLDRAAHPNTPEPEADLCRQQAERLMLKYSISSAKLESQEKRKARIGEWDVNIHGAHVRHRGQLLTAIAGIFSCKVIIFSRGRQYSYELVGRESDLPMVYALFEHLLTQLDHKIWSLGRVGQDYKKSYILSYVGVVRERLRDLYTEEVGNDTGTELVLAGIRDEVERYVRDQHGDLKTSSSLSNSSLVGAMHGEHDGSEADIFLPGSRFDQKQTHSIES